jgi:hypothetical protein
VAFVTVASTYNRTPVGYIMSTCTSVHAWIFNGLVSGNEV